MERSRVWPDFRQAWLLFEDPDIVVVDKPAGISSQAADPDRPDDLVTRLKAYMSSRPDEGDAYLGVHQRLDRDTSGLLVFAKRREANAHLAAQFEHRQVKKTYLAGVTGWPRGREKATLRDALSATQGGVIAVVRPRTPGSKDAVTHVRVLTRRGDRALLELELDTGRTHQARVQLAHAGAPIAGDALYSGAVAPRLLLHASALGFEHPRTRTPLRFEASTPPEFASWLDHGPSGEAVYDDPGALARALDRAIDRRWGLGRSARPHETTAFRLVNEEGDGLPRLAVDAYDGWLVVQLYGSDGLWADERRRERLLDALQAFGFDGVYLKVRPKQANVVVDPRREDIAPSHPLRGAPSASEIVILEEGVPFVVRLADGLSTGLFLDQRANRRRVREMAEGKAVANLFAYTCAFTVVAALGGARRTVSLDASVTALERGRANLAGAGVLERGEHAFVADDAFAWLAKTERRGDRFDLVILDPPSYSTTRRGRFVANSDYASLAASAMRILSPGGKLLACTNHRGISESRFRRILFDAGRAAERHVVQVKDLPVATDFPVPPGAEPHMKSALVTLAD